MDLYWGIFFYILIDEVVQVLEMEMLVLIILVGYNMKVVFIGDYMQVCEVVFIFGFFMDVIGNERVGMVQY